MHICLKLYVIEKTNTNRQTGGQADIWIDINREVKVAVNSVKNDFFPLANYFMHMFNMSLMNLQCIRICQQILRVKLISPCMHYLSCIISEHTKPSRQELLTMATRKSCYFDGNIFLASYVFLHSMCDESAKCQIASTNTLRWADFTVDALLSCQSSFSRRTKGINHNGMNPYKLTFLYNNIS